jgi:hypothetical protein
MEELFITSLAGKENERYTVVFDHEQYIFTSGAGEQFSFRREHDEWLTDNQLPEDLQTQAIEALEKYLLRQH